jgi:hypothetical protein
MKPLAFAADAESCIYRVWVFNGRFAISSPKPPQLPTCLESKGSAQPEYYHPWSTAKKKC